MPAPAIIWLRLDLRLADNPSLEAAVKHGGPVIPVFIHDPEAEGHWQPGGASNWWLHHALLDLAEQFEKAGSPLVIRHGDSLAELKQLVKETGADLVTWNRRHEPLIIERDTQVKTSLRNAGVKAESFNGNLLHEPHLVKTLAGNPFQVFTPFWKNCLANLKFGIPLKAPKKLTPFEKSLKSVAVDKLGLLPKIKWDTAFPKHWDPTRKGAEKRLKNFVAAPVKNYPTNRDIPKLDGTSRLSPYLHFGQISPLEIVDAVRTAGLLGVIGGDKYVAEIGWREFAQHLIHHFPETPDRPLRKEFEKFPWQPDKKLLRAWQVGRTGYPIVDADLGANTMGWQWAGGCGADAAPYFRVFNPVLQGEKFDPDGDYVRRWVPELAKLPAEWIHQPWEAPMHVLAEAGIKLGKDYPVPLIGLTEGRDRALKALKALRP